MREPSLVINGQQLPGAGAALQTIHPATGQIGWSGHGASIGQTEQAIRAARAAFTDWARWSFDDRCAVARRYAEIVTREKDALAQLIATETGKPLWDAHGEAASVAAKVEISIHAYQERTGEMTGMVSGAHLRVRHRPHGLMLVLGPFNFPAHLPNGHIVPALLAGNAVLFKPSEKTPATALLLARLWGEAGLPPGVLNVLQGEADLAAHLVAHDQIDGVLFTGGLGAGLAIHRQLAGRPDKLLALELGGNNPLIVWDAADVQAAARLIVLSAFLTSGQRCTCARRLIVPDGDAGDRIVDAVLAVMDRLIVGAPQDDPAPFMGPVISAEAADAVLAAQQGLIDRGAQPLRPCKRLPLGDAYLSPGLLDVTSAADMPDEEVFGPLLQIIRVPDFDAALDTANDTRFGLAAGLISDDAAFFETAQSRLRAGIVNWNRPTTGAASAAPFGGVGLSGNHRPAGYTAADYCAWPVASLQADSLTSTEIPNGVRS